MNHDINFLLLNLSMVIKTKDSWSGEVVPLWTVSGEQLQLMNAAHLSAMSCSQTRTTQPFSTSELNCWKTLQASVIYYSLFSHNLHIKYHSYVMYVSSNYFSSLTAVRCSNEWFSSRIYWYSSFVIIVQHLFTSLRIYCA